MGSVFVNVGLSLDGYITPDGMTMENPGYRNWGAKWGELMAWLLDQRYMRETLKLGTGGETGPVNDLVRSTAERIGANIMGKRMFDQGERVWPEEAPFHTPVYVLTNARREPWARPGGTTFHFVNDGPQRALELARESAGGKDIRIAGGADVIRQYPNFDVVDELEIALAPPCSSAAGLAKPCRPCPSRPMVRSPQSTPAGVRRSFRPVLGIAADLARG